MKKALIEELIKVAKDRCDEILIEPDNKNYDKDSFVAGYLYCLAEHMKT
jgi:hypothetical protein